jgi:phosphonate transport system substrate-binding protein
MSIKTKFKLPVATLCASLTAFLFTTPVLAGELPTGSKDDPLRVMMIPADTGGADVTQDFKPVFDAIADKFGIYFELKAGSSYAAVVKGLCEEQTDLAWYGAVTFGQAKDLCGAELLAVDVKKGESVYYSGIYTARDSGMQSLSDLKGKSLAVGSVSSTSSFNFPMAMVLNAQIDPVKDLSKIVIAGSHTNSIAALKEGRVDAAAASFNSWEKAVNNGIIDPSNFKVLAKSEPIPNPPMAMNKNLSPELKTKLRNAFNNIHKYVSAEKIRGYGGKKVDRYDANYPEEKMLAVLRKLSKVTDELKREIVEKAGER